MGSLDKDINKIRKVDKLAKTYKGEYYSINSIMANT